PIEVLALESLRQHGAGAVLLQAHEREILTRTPDQATLAIDAGAVGPDQDHVDSRDVRELAGVGEVIAAVARLVQEHRNLAGRGHFVDDVADDADHQQIALLAVVAAHPDRAIAEPESRGDRGQLRIRRDEGVEGRIELRDAERVRLRIRRLWLSARDGQPQTQHQQGIATEPWHGRTPLEQPDQRCGPWITPGTFRRTL